MPDFPNNESFTRVLDLTELAQIYDLTAGELRREARETADDLNVVFWWSSTDPEADAPITLAQIPARGYATFNDNPAAAEALNLGGTAVTFVSTTPSGNQVLVGVDKSATLASLVVFLNASADANISKCTYSSVDDDDSTALVIEHKTAGTAGNNFSLTTTSDSIELSSATLMYGGLGAVETATYEQVKDFAKPLVTDLVYINGATRIRLMPQETYNFIQGITR